MSFPNQYSSNNYVFADSERTHFVTQEGNNIVVSPSGTQNPVHQQPCYEASALNYSSPNIPPPVLAQQSFPPPLYPSSNIYQGHPSDRYLSRPTMVSRKSPTPPPRCRMRYRSSSEDERRSRNCKRKRDKRARKSRSSSSCSSSNIVRKNCDKICKDSKSRSKNSGKEDTGSSKNKIVEPHKRHRPEEEKIIVHGIGKEICLFCYNATGFNSQEKLAEHSRICHKDKMFRCILCESPTYYPSFQDIKMHLQVGHKVGKPEHFVKCPATQFLKSLECEMCPENGSIRSKFVAFTEVSLKEIHFVPCHLTKKTFLKRICRICDSSSHSTDESLTNHIETVHSGMLKNRIDSGNENDEKEKYEASSNTSNSEDCCEISDSEIKRERKRKVHADKLAVALSGCLKGIHSVQKSAEKHLQIPSGLAKSGEIKIRTDKERHTSKRQEKVVEQNNTTESDSSTYSGKNDKEREHESLKKHKKKHHSRDAKKYKKEKKPKRNRRSRSNSSCSSNDRSKRRNKDRQHSPFKFKKSTAPCLNKDINRFETNCKGKSFFDKALYANDNKEIDEATKIATDYKNAKMKNALKLSDGRDIFTDLPKHSSTSRTKDYYISSLQRPNSKDRPGDLFSSRFKLKDGFCDDCNVPYTAEKAPEHYNSKMHYTKTFGKFRCQICLAFNNDIKVHLEKYHSEDVFDCNVCPDIGSNYRTLEMRKMLDHFYNFHPSPGKMQKGQQLPNRNNLLLMNKIIKPKSIECFGCKLCNANFMCTLEQVVEHQLLEDGILTSQESDIRFTCRVCGPAKEFDDYKFLKKHIETHCLNENDLKRDDTNRSRSMSSNHDIQHSKDKFPGNNKVYYEKLQPLPSHSRSYSPSPYGGSSSKSMANDFDEAARSRSNTSHSSLRNKIMVNDIQDKNANRYGAERIVIKDQNNSFLQYHCFYCSQEFKTSNVKQRHITMQHNPNLFACDLKCTSFTANTRKQMLIHLDEVHYYYHDENRSKRTQFLKEYSIPPKNARQVSCNLCRRNKRKDMCNDDTYDEYLVGVWMSQGLDTLRPQLINHMKQNHPSKLSQVENPDVLTMEESSNKSGTDCSLQRWFRLECRLCNDTFIGKQCVEKWEAHVDNRHDQVDSLKPDINYVSSDESENLKCAKANNQKEKESSTKDSPITIE